MLVDHPTVPYRIDVAAPTGLVSVVPVAARPGPTGHGWRSGRHREPLLVMREPHWMSRSSLRPALVFPAVIGRSEQPLSGSWRGQRFGWGQSGGADGGVESGGAADECGGGKPACGRPGRYDGRPGLVRGVAGGDGDAEQNATGAAEGGQQEGFGEELQPDLSSGGAE